ncbi:MAG: PIN domain nuclease [Candidatus Omnitrophota bacterium]|nr:MAG: PIN domain nuclease [Candidatus Omnitrophota bacterium]
MGLNLIRGIFIIFSCIAGVYLFPLHKVIGIIVGFFGSLCIIGVEMLIAKIPIKKLMIGIGGLIVGLITAILFTNFLLLIPLEDKSKENLIRFVFYYIFTYLGIMTAVKGVGELGFIIPYLHGIEGEGEKLLIADTSVLIDGRIYDIMKGGFLDYTIVVPKFIINELHSLSDCSSDLKRQRGRRGLEILRKMRDDPSIDLKIYDIDFPDIEAVDAKLVKLASILRAKILTNDYNLTKVAEIQNIKVLNLNNLANIMKPRLISGEQLTIKIVKEGKEAGQGVGYLEDGTMIVVENAARYIGKIVEVIVDSTIQTPSGRIIFAKLK